MYHCASISDSCMYWCLAYIREGISDLRIYVAVASPYPPDRGVTGWYQSLGSDIFSTISWQINDVLICSWRARVLNIHSNCKYDVIYSFLAILSLDPETLLSFSFSFFLSSLQPTQIWKDGGPVTVLALLATVLMEMATTWWGYCMAWWKVSISRQSSCGKHYWQHLESRGL